MSKQIKLGFDRVPSRSLETDQVLVDAQGEELTDKNGLPLYTPTEGVPTSFYSARNSTSVFVNNESSDAVGIAGKSISVAEQFPLLSEVSSSLLGIPRLGKQQSLLADVSVYGMDVGTWEFYRAPNPYEPPEWRRRINRVYGQRYYPRLKEYDREQALAIEMYPAPFTFPFGPKWESNGLYNESRFQDYINFVIMGNFLHEYFTAQNYGVFANQNFLPRELARVEGNDVIYADNLDLAFEYVEAWTTAWILIRRNELTDPRGALNPNDPTDTTLTTGRVEDLLSSFGNEQEKTITFENTAPGYNSSNRDLYCQLQSREAFRYQPGAISGFTFGARLNADRTNAENVIEWGCANESDHLMFQVRGENFSIVRRSTVPLSEKTIELLDMVPEDQIQVQSPNPFERTNTSYTTTDLGLPPKPTEFLYELTIPREKFNGDPLDGTGRSGYTLSFSDVTMYKIEYSWYGAIGAKFYAYVPVSNDEARWVLMHTLVIENTLSTPSLKNPFMHFRYSIRAQNTSSLIEPIYLYKYGASYYIDGGDEGTFSYNSYGTSLSKIAPSTQSKPIIGFQPKTFIKNRDSAEVRNQKKFYIDDISISSSQNTRVDILECEGCPGGHGHFYAASLQNGQRGVVDTFRLTSTGITFESESVFTLADNEKKIIAPGIFSSYVLVDQDSLDADASTAKIGRRLGRSQNSVNTTIVEDSPYTGNDTAIVNGEEINLLDNEDPYVFTARLTGFDDVIASETPITKKNFKIQFLNPVALETLGQWAEFRIGVTQKTPEVVDGVLLFGGQPLDMQNEVYADFSQNSPRKNAAGADFGEEDRRIGNIMEQDYRLSSPKGAYSGQCSELNFEIRDIAKPTTGIEYVTTPPESTPPLDGNHFLTLTTPLGIERTNGGGIGIYDANGIRFIDSGITFTSDVATYEFEGDTRYVVAISGFLDVPSLSAIALKTMRTFGRHVNKTKILPFGNDPYYLWIAMRDNARLNNIVVKEFDETSSFSHTPDWIAGDDCNIEVIAVQNNEPPSGVVDKLTTSREYIGTDGLFYMGGVTDIAGTPANFVEKNRLSAVEFDDQLYLPLRPSSIKSSIHVGANKTESIKMSHLFGVNRFKLGADSFGNKSVYLSAISSDAGSPAEIILSVSSKEQ